ncbi:cytochrome d ubiquinol oxidase subunit II [Neptunomonas phycophila]|jgi:cytochrome d ubiquinol oxidase subunit II|nr:cytochrome d ubiquinol oxidase subunit II [Neptunomonas phycophila]
MMNMDLSMAWALIIGFGLMMYVLLDGFDLGLGILFPFIDHPDERDVMVNTVAPVWDGNETWLVMGGAALMAAFPLAYSLVLSALYIPLVFMLIGLILRGVAFEFRFKADEHHRPFWDKAFIVGSYLATFCQGAAMGAFIDGFAIENERFVGGALDWLTPFSVFTGISLLVAYALLGSTWLVMKTEGGLQKRMRALSRPITFLLLAVIAGISIWSPIAHPEIASRWFTMPYLLYFSPVPILVVLVAFGILQALNRRAEAMPFIMTLGLLFLGYSGLIISLWPNIIPPDITLQQAAAPAESQRFTLVGALIIIPCILAYTFWSYYVFRGKVRVGDGYH